MVHMIGVSDFEKTGANPDNGNSVFYVLLECGHGQTVETHMPKPPSRVMCRECLDVLEAVQTVTRCHSYG